MKTNSQRLVSGSVLLALNATGVAYAQGFSPESAVPGDASRIEEVIVTARKFEERLIDLPLSVSSLSGVEIENRNIESLVTLSGSWVDQEVDHSAQFMQTTLDCAALTGEVALRK